VEPLVAIAGRTGALNSQKEVVNLTKKS